MTFVKRIGLTIMFPLFILAMVYRLAELGRLKNPDHYWHIWEMMWMVYILHIIDRIERNCKEKK